jgi:hypothetical protein
MIKKIFAALLILTNCYAAMPELVPLDEVDINEFNFYVPAEHTVNEDQVKLIFNRTGFIVKKDSEFTPIKAENTHVLFRKMDLKNMVKYSIFNKFRIEQNSNGDYIVRPVIELKGGGIGGANVGFFAGKFAVHFVAHSVIAVVSLATGPAAGPTALSLEATFMPWIESTSNIVACGTAILVGTATGPV